MNLRRRQHDIDDEAFAALAADVRAAVSSPPGEETARRHLAAMREATAEQPHPEAKRAGRRRSVGPLRPALRLAAIAAASVTAFGGTSAALAAAGVDLPDPISAPFDAVGIDLPNQTPSDDGARDRDAAPPERERPGATTPRDERPASGGRSDPKKPSRSGRSSSGDAPGRTERGERGRSGAAPGRTERGERGRSEAAPGRQKDNRGASGATERGRPATPGRSGTVKRRGTTNRPANPAPKKSVDRGAGPQRPVKPTTPPAQKPQTSGRKQDAPLAPDTTSAEPKTKNDQEQE